MASLMDSFTIKHRNLWKAFWQTLIFTVEQLIPFIICCLGALTQATDLLAIYFSFPTIASVNMYSPNYITLPAVTLCLQFDLDEVIDLTEEQLNGSPTIKSEDLRFDLTLEQLNNVTPSVGQFVDLCLVANSTASSSSYIDLVDCYQVEPVRVNLNAYRKCYTFFNGNQSPFTYSKIVFYDEYFLRIRLNITIASRPYFQLIIHDNDQEVYSNHGSPEMIAMDSNRFNDFVFTYYTEQMNGLGSPYSDCLDYYQLYKTTKHDLVKKCIFTSIYSDYKAFNDQILVRLPFTDNANVTFIRGIRASRYRSQCELKYIQPECSTKSFRLVLLRSLNNPLLFDQAGLISVMFAYPIGTQTNVTILPKQDPVEYFCYIASIINLWLEISILGVVQFLFRNFRQLISKLLNKRQSKSACQR